MDNNKFYEILNFAIQREIEAANFYHDLQGRSKFDSSREMFKDLENMEWGHAKALERYKEGDIENFTPPKIMNLNISEFLVEPEVTSDMLYQDALIIAMKREESSKRLYAAIAEESEDTATKNFFLKLASEEEKHKLMLETQYDEIIYNEN
ncbi:MAG: ferritin family protein [Bacteroidota bacterium]|jgi:rubrerythrin